MMSFEFSDWALIAIAVLLFYLNLSAREVISLLRAQISNTYAVKEQLQRTRERDAQPS